MSEPLGLGMDEPVERGGGFPRLGEQRRARLAVLGEAIPTNGHSPKPECCWRGGFI